MHIYIVTDIHTYLPATEPMAPAKEPAKNFKKKEESDLTPNKCLIGAYNPIHIYICILHIFISIYISIYIYVYVSDIYICIYV
jgi:hypothetical protein